jgi:2-C-methyl-D-erythritol 2,4-cyclodiphosphate synthase
MVSNEGFFTGNVDATLILESPNVSSKREKMIGEIEKVVNAPVNLKATTAENMGFIGQGDGIGAQAIALIRSDQ